jgi:hypothetical protein
MRIPSPAIAVPLIPCLAAILHTDAGAASGQSKPKNTLSISGTETIPLENRAVLFQRIRAYIQAERKHDWATLYDLTAPEMNVNETKEAFVAKHRRDAKEGTLFELFDFEINDMGLSPEGRARSWGPQSVRKVLVTSM